MTLERLRITFTANLKMNYVTDFSLYLPTITYFIDKKMSTFMSGSSTKIILYSFYLLIT